MKIFITGGAGFIGSHVAEFYAKKGVEVVVYDNLSRMHLLGQKNLQYNFNWDYLKQFDNVHLIQGDILDQDLLEVSMKGADAVVHTAGQTAVTSSYEQPDVDFKINALGSFQVLEAARKQEKKPSIVFCSTNKVYGKNVNDIALEECGTRYQFSDKRYKEGIPEEFSIDHCERSPYGCSKLAADIYMQDYASYYGLKVGVFRMSCIYGTRQFGLEDQGWLAWFSIAALLDKTINFYGDGKQVRDILFVTDLVNAFDAFIQNSEKSLVVNMGGGEENTISLLELKEVLEQQLSKKIQVEYGDWRPNDQKVYISNINKAKKELNWSPTTSPEAGVHQLVTWIQDHLDVFTKNAELNAVNK